LSIFVRVVEIFVIIVVFVFLDQVGACLELNGCCSVWSWLSDVGGPRSVHIWGRWRFLTVVVVIQALFRIMTWSLLFMLSNFDRALNIVMKIDLLYLLLRLLQRLVSATFEGCSRSSSFISGLIFMLFINYSLFKTNRRSLMLSLKQRWGPFYLCGLISNIVFAHVSLRLVEMRTIFLFDINSVRLWQSL
jgi:hypothetical protein